MKKTNDELIRISVRVGLDSRLVQGGGGNTSAKSADGKRMSVKASGTSLAEMSSQKGFREMDLEKVNAILDDPALTRMPATAREQEIVTRLMDACVDDRPGRPSVESSLHALLGRFVVHTHPAILNGLLCARNGRHALLKLIEKAGLSCVHVPYCDPGFPLARLVKNSIDQYAARAGALPQVILLQNHGVFVSADAPDTALEITERICSLAQREYERVARPRKIEAAEETQTARIQASAAAIRRYLAERGASTPLLRFVSNETVNAFLASPNRRKLANVRPLFPDQIVYLGDRLTWLTLPVRDARIDAHLTTRLAKLLESRSNAFIVDGLGLFVAGANLKALDTNAVVATATLEVLLVADAFGGPGPLTARQAKYIAEWEVELYRQKLLAGSAQPAQLAGKVAIVTGGGSGLGRGISIGLAKEGAFVVLADIDEFGARESVSMIGETCGQERAIAVRADVTDEASVAALLAETVGRIGGVDILVNAAGIAPVYPLVDFPLRAWQKTLDINLTGYFLVARETARCMIRQQTGGSIINLSSKTGLFPSKNHSGYNATKSGEIHLARGWALELADHKIRVNVVCPGNVFHGSKIWNPQYIEALAKKRGIEPEEVIPYYINLTALKEDITWDDIANGVTFLCGDRASKITGQTLVVDAGQVFVR